MSGTRAMRALLVGYGKMGRAIEAALVTRGHVVAGRIDRESRDFLEGKDSRGEGQGAAGERSGGGRGGAGAPSFEDIDLAFEFTAPDAAPTLVTLFLSKRIPVVSGSTGWDTTQAARQAREQNVPFLHSANFSIGVAVARRLAAQAAALLAPFPGFEPGILERHHSAKRDAPSGTAKLLAGAVGGARPGAPGVPIVALRQGGNPGEHVLFFEGESETLEIAHRARSRAIFASGAVHAAEWMLASGRRGPLTFEDFLSSLSERSQP